MSNSDFFDASYVQPPLTTSNLKKSSDIKNFLKTPIDESDLKKYGYSKPQRTIIRASIKNG